MYKKNTEAQSEKAKPIETTYIVRKLDTGFAVTKDSKVFFAFSTLEEVIKEVTEIIKILDLTSKQGRIEAGCNALKITIVPTQV